MVSRGVKNYSCRWTGYLQARRSEEFTLTLDVNDGGRLWFEGQLVIDAWDRPQIKSTSVGALEAGRKYPIRVEHHKGAFESTGGWRAMLSWQSPSIKREIIPITQFYPATH
jgi:hypothetical protein